ncbi:MAG TPA: CDP-alcohol phosphatidyltransferase family protein [Bacteroidota bacterium]|nr:CDP-alcohol phosphatidyltransferase family protein [Bacteroidota bacterium]
MTTKVFTLSNILSLSRIALLIPMVGMLYATSWPHHRLYAIVVVMLGMVTDFLDRYFARKYNEVSELGKIIDPLADKICVAVIVVILAVTGDIPLWYMAIVLARDVLIFFGGVYVKMKKGVVLASMMSGKVAVVFIALTLTFALLGNPLFALVVLIFMWFSIGAMGLSVAVYGKRFFEVLKQ